MRFIIFCAAVGLLAAPAKAANLTICVKRISAKDPDFTASFLRGPILIPAGTVFETAGPAFGPASNPNNERDDGNVRVPASSSPDRVREHLGRAIENLSNGHQSGLVTTSDVTLTKGKACVAVTVAAAYSRKWGWMTSPIFGSSETYYQVFGVIRGNKLDTSFENQSSPLNFAAARGFLNGVLSGTTDRTIQISGN